MQNGKGASLIGISPTGILEYRSLELVDNTFDNG